MSYPTKRVPIKLGDGTKKRYLRFDFPAISRLEEEIGEPLELTLRRATSLSARAISGLVWAGLLHAEPDLTREQVVKLIPLDKVKEVLEAVLKAVKVGTGQKVDEEPAETGDEGEGKGETAEGGEG
jgi:hypothetical protein